MSDLRIFHVEIETEREAADYDLLGALDDLARSVAAESGSSYRITVVEHRDVIVTRHNTLARYNGTCATSS